MSTTGAEALVSLVINSTPEVERALMNSKTINSINNMLGDVNVKISNIDNNIGVQAREISIVKDNVSSVGKEVTNIKKKWCIQKKS